MSHSINWDLLEDQYLSDGVYREKLSKMVTIVDEAFLAGKKFARTYSQNIEHTPNIHKDIKKDCVIDTIKYNSFKNVDITYKESRSANNSVQIDDNNNNIEKKATVPSNVTVLDSQDVNLKEDLKRLLDDNKISKFLYDKLTSNKNFELEPQDIDDINKLHDGRIKQLLLKTQTRGKIYLHFAVVVFIYYLHFNLVYKINVLFFLFHNVSRI